MTLSIKTFTKIQHGTYKDFTHKDFTYNNNKCDITNMFLFTVVRKISYEKNQLFVMSLEVMSPVFSVKSIAIISKVVTSKVIICIVIVSFF